MPTELRQDHDALRGMMREFAHVMRTQGPEALPDITRRRIAFSQLFRDHMGREDALVVALRTGRTAVQSDPVARDHSRAMVALFLRYSDHIKNWTPARIERDWSGYRDSVLELQQGLLDRMAWEEQHLHPLMAEAPRRAA
ncbi:hemerythrin domain-containing protein [Sphingobium sp. 3R8]|uniref:hemerythrin domain-containing protein n=1 Tax=Sphingobium sp. 3R8 TaxID=2874921 RepID=UPI001CC998CD|nr:hemerythrin domain-containing protein [Sphingobium sp. 3R8]MBZ9648789.1 hemerythrin domain-containing protein [Sphingobium sp. 3R8]